VLSASLAVAGAFVACGTPSPAGAAKTTSAREGQRQVTFVNHMAETIWVAATPGNAPARLATTGWKLPAGEQITITVPNHWNGRFWGRTGCHFDTTGEGACQTGDCAGRLQCKGFGSIPATLAEYNLDAWDNLDFYDVSMVDGSNLPMYINRFGDHGRDAISADGCSATGCTKAVICPPVLQARVGGVVVGCLSACARFKTDQYCCRGKWSGPSTCNPELWPVDYAAVFKRAEPFAYSYAYDDATSLFTCYGGCDYRITFGLTPTDLNGPTSAG
jgi:hypothetical protein